MTERRPPPSLGTYRPTQDRTPDPRRQQDPRRADFAGDPAWPQEPRSRTAPPVAPPADNLWHEPEEMPRIVTSRVHAPPPPPPGPMVPPDPRTRSRRLPPPVEHEGMSGLKILLYCCFGLFAFVAAAAVAAFVLVPTGLIRDRLQAEVKARTGRDLVIAGPTSLSLWPRPSVSVRDVTLSAPPEMGAQPLLKVAEVEVAVQILPLLLHDVSVDRLLLRRPQFDLRVDANGRRSWDFAALDMPRGAIKLAQAGSGDKALPKELQDFMKGSTEPDKRAPNAPPKSRVGDVSLGNVSIVDGSVHYRDARSAVDETVTGLNAQLALANIASPLDVTSDFTWRGEAVALTAQVSPFRALLEGRPIEARIKSSAGPLSLSFEGTVTPGNDLDLDGRVKADAAAIDRLAAWTGRPLAGSLPGGFSIDARVKQTATLTAFNDARLTVGPLTGSGTLSVDTHGARPYVKGAIRVATLDLNMLQAIGEKPALTPVAANTPVARPAPTQPANPAPPQSIEDLLKDDTAPVVAARKPQVRGYTKRQGWSDDALDLSPLGLVDADVRLGFDHIVWQDLSTGVGQISLAMKSKAVRISLEDVQLYDGRARGIATIDAAAGDAIVGANVVVDGVSALPFLKAVSDFDWLSGRARVAIAVAGRGATERQIVSTLNGKADIAIADGALLGLNINTIVTNLGRGKFGGLDRSPTEKTDFSEFAASTQITNGIAHNDDLRIASAQLRATGAGTIDLPQRTMDYVLKPKVTAGVGAGLDVPLKIVGSIDKPTVTPDIGGINPNQAVKAIQDAAKTPAGREVQETIQGVINGDPAAKAKVKGFLDQLLKK